MTDRTCFLCEAPFNDDDFGDLMPSGAIWRQPPGWAVDDAYAHFDLGNHDPVCPSCTESKVLDLAWGFVEREEAHYRNRHATA